MRIRVRTKKKDVDRDGDGARDPPAAGRWPWHRCGHAGQAVPVCPRTGAQGPRAGGPGRRHGGGGPAAAAPGRHQTCTPVLGGTEGWARCQGFLSPGSTAWDPPVLTEAGTVAGRTGRVAKTGSDIHTGGARRGWGETGSSHPWLCCPGRGGWGGVPTRPPPGAGSCSAPGQCWGAAGTRS